MTRQSKSRKAEAAAKPRPLEPPRLPRELVARTPAKGWGSWLVPALIAVVTFATFLPALHNQFVNWDDDKNFLENPHYRGLGWTQLSWMWTTHLGHYIPLTWMTFGLDYLLWGMNPLGYHLTNLLLHAANAVVFFFITRRLLTRALPSPSERGHTLAVSAAFAALVFAIHPLRVESVAWATERRDVLSGLFYLSAVLAYLRACDREERGRGWYWGAVALFAGALLSKSMAVNLPVVLMILDVYPLRRLGGSIGWWSKPARRIYVEKIPFVLLAAAASAIAVMAQFSIHAALPLAQLSVPGRLAVSAYGLSFYLGKMIVPVNLSPLYELPRTVSPWAMPFILSFGLAVAITAIVLSLRRRMLGLPAAWLAYLVVLLPVLGIFQSGPQIAADRYTYLAGLGWAILAGAGLLSSWSRLPFLLIGLVVFIPVGLGTLTWNQVHVWHDSKTLWAHALAIDPNSSVAQNDFGEALAQQGKLAEAIEHYRQALNIKPDYADAHYNLGGALAQQGKLADAIHHYQRALQITPGDADAQTNWGGALAQQGKLAEAAEHYQQALRIKPDHAAAHNNWGAALTRQGNLAEAIEHYRQAVNIKPDYADAHYNLGGALAQQGKLADAIHHYQRALQITPDDADAHIHWGLALAQQGRLAEAIEHYRQALRINPGHADAQSNLLNAIRGLDRRK